MKRRFSKHTEEFEAQIKELEYSLFQLSQEIKKKIITSWALSYVQSDENYTPNIGI